MTKGGAQNSLEPTTKRRSKSQEPDISNPRKRKAQTLLESDAIRPRITQETESGANESCEFCDNPIILLISYATWEYRRRGGKLAEHHSEGLRFWNDSHPLTCPKKSCRYRSMEYKIMNRFPVENAVNFSPAARNEAKELLWDVEKKLPEFVKGVIDYHELKTQLSAALLWVFKGGRPSYGTNANLFEAYKKLSLVHLSYFLYERFDNWNLEN